MRPISSRGSRRAWERSRWRGWRHGSNAWPRRGTWWPPGGCSVSLAPAWPPPWQRWKAGGLPPGAELDPDQDCGLANDTTTRLRSHAMIYANPGQADAVITFDKRYGNYIGGEFVPPVKGEYFDNVSPVNGEVFCQIPRSTAEDIDLARSEERRVGKGVDLGGRRITRKKMYTLVRATASMQA